MNEMARSANPSAEAQTQLEHALQTSPVARKAFGAEYMRRGNLLAKLRNRKRSLPRWLIEDLERDFPRVRSYDELKARAERTGEAAPELVLEPEPGMDG